MDKKTVWKVIPSLDRVPFRFVAYIEAANMDEAGKIFESYFNMGACGFQRMDEKERYAL